MSQQAANLHTLGPIVVAQKVVWGSGWGGGQDHRLRTVSRIDYRGGGGGGEGVKHFYS